jgi:hypothetical protein
MVISPQSNTGIVATNGIRSTVNSSQLNKELKRSNSYNTLPEIHPLIANSKLTRFLPDRFSSVFPHDQSFRQAPKLGVVSAGSGRDFQTLGGYPNSSLQAAPCSSALSTIEQNVPSSERQSSADDRRAGAKWTVTWRSLGSRAGTAGRGGEGGKTRSIGTPLQPIHLLAPRTRV